MFIAATELERILYVLNAMEIDLESILFEEFERGLLSDLNNAF